MRVGLGFDIHRTDPDRVLILGGVQVEAPFGLAGYSDADVVTHAVIDALLGAMGMGDIGDRFPNTDMCHKDRSSLNMLDEVMETLQKQGYVVVNVDCNIIAQKPKLATYKPLIEASLAKVLKINEKSINVKAKTHETIGPLGACEAIEAQAIALIQKEM